MGWLMALVHILLQSGDASEAVALQQNICQAHHQLTVKLA